MPALPIYRLERPEVSTNSLVDLAARLFDLTDFTFSEPSGRVALTSRSHVVEIHPISGGIWAADSSRLFNPALRPKLPNRKKALALAIDLVESRKLLPELGGRARWGDPHVAGTHLATMEGKKRTDVDLDVQVVFPVMIDDLPVVGGGGDFTVVLGDGGAPIGFHGVWRTFGDAFDAEVLSQELAEQELLAQLDGSGLEVKNLVTQLAYYSAPASEGQEFLYPIYAIGGSARAGKQLVPLRTSFFPATEFGPRRPDVAPQEKRPARVKPPVTKPKERHGARRAAGGDAARRSYQTVTADLGASLGTGRAPTKPWEAGASWIGVSGGLTGSRNNAGGFIDEWRNDGWIIDFNWGDANAFESDWRRNDDTWVDNADFVFYTGHANMNGWVLANPDDTFLSVSEVGAGPASPGDLWGQNDLEWVVVAACGPLQDEILSAGGGDVLSRWDGAFDGLHLLMGYGAVTSDTENEGRSLARYAKEGQMLRDAWLRTAKENQNSMNSSAPPDGPTIWAGVMWVTKPGVDPINDHAWSHGSVSADPTSPTGLACMWTVC